MELEADYISPKLKPLVLAGGATDQPDRVFRQVERLPVPVEHPALGGKLEAVIGRLLGVIGNQPISFNRLGYTRVPRQLAIS